MITLTKAGVISFEVNESEFYSRQENIQNAALDDIADRFTVVDYLAESFWEFVYEYINDDVYNTTVESFKDEEYGEGYTVTIDYEYMTWLLKGWAEENQEEIGYGRYIGVLKEGYISRFSQHEAWYINSVGWAMELTKYSTDDLVELFEGLTLEQLIENIEEYDMLPLNFSGGGREAFVRQLTEDYNVWNYEED